MSDSLSITKQAVSVHMDKILGYFKDGSKITVIVRQPDDCDGRMDFVMSSDTLPEVAAVVSRRMESGQ